ncbi:MAG: threonine/serine exporter family protein [Gemmatirosa sp.]|nr:threonine/serine exporter family protein [Gemmatirosa sp.]
MAFVLRLARALHVHGHSAGRLEDILGITADRLGLPAHQFFSTPTSVMASFGVEVRQRTYLLRVEPAEVNLGMLAALERVSLDVARGRLSPPDGTAEIERIVAAPSPYGPSLTTIAYGAVSGAACVFLGGGAREVMVALVLGLGLGVFSLVAQQHPRIGRVFEPFASFLVSAAAIVLAHAVGPLSVLAATISGLIVLMPGLTLTTAMSELATRHLASGTARLSGAFITFLGIAFGVALGNRLGAALIGAPPNVDPTPLPMWAGLVALVVAPLSFTVILRAAPRDTPWIVAAGALGVAGGRLGAATLGVELGAFAGSFAVALAGSGYERWRRRPSAVVVVPGILQLVPGSVGFRSLLSLMDREPVVGLQTAFSMIMTAIALVAGLLMASVVVPEVRVRR